MLDRISAPGHSGLSMHFPTCLSAHRGHSCLRLRSIKSALYLFNVEVNNLVDELDDVPDKESKNCQVYYVRDDYSARKVSGIKDLVSLF